MAAIVRPSDDRMIGGVCAGLARRFGTTPNTMRVIFLASCLLPGPQFLLYIAL
ncbi:PspC domain-containing protein, partial [Streptomyces radiopugnans]|uniref:PspC domain-containing protein n=2 Tax=Streptomyces TaxID=1883 RepID=UPI003F1A91E8